MWSQPASEPLGMTASGEAAGNFIAETTQFVRHYLPGAVAVAFGGGVLVGWLIARGLKTRLSAGNEEREMKATEDKINKRAISRWEGEGGAIP